MYNIYNIHNMYIYIYIYMFMIFMVQGIYVLHDDIIVNKITCAVLIKTFDKFNFSWT